MAPVGITGCPGNTVTAQVSVTGEASMSLTSVAVAADHVVETAVGVKVSTNVGEVEVHDTDTGA